MGELLQADLTVTIEALKDIDAIPFTLDAVQVGRVVGAKATFDINELEDGQIEISEAIFAPKPEKKPRG